MKKIKVVLVILIAAFIGIVAYQNRGFFLAKQRIGLNLWVIEPYSTPEIYNIIHFLIWFGAGLLIAYFFGLLGQFRKNKTIKHLNASLDSLQKENTLLKDELEAAKAAMGSPPMGADADFADTAEATQKLEDTVDSTG